ncbi:outer membrane protein assembly factor BamB family protein [Brevibacillus dissolubilis]|uniref:outer membrane protein assembly factor BamB family protein n=1 Tax=Brevibacillus dissolubilis TaxID=1844116 RepID=UPI00111705A1|nr:PQQ-binding-like beta-propeller repeat protein [Brevibacillus dissolubilis]
MMRRDTQSFSYLLLAMTVLVGTLFPGNILAKTDVIPEQIQEQPQDQVQNETADEVLSDDPWEQEAEPVQAESQSQTPGAPTVSWSYKPTVYDSEVPTTNETTWESITEQGDTIYQVINYVYPRKALQALDKNGKKKWEILTNHDGAAFPYQPVISKDNWVYAYNRDYEVLEAYNANGQMVWDYSIAVALPYDDVIPVLGKKGEIFVLDDLPAPKYAKVVALNARTGDLLWEKEVDAGHELAVSPDGTLYTYGFSGLYTFEAANGQLRWKKNDQNITMSPVFDRNGTPYIFNHRGVTGLNKEDGSLKMKFEPGYTTPGTQVQEDNYTPFSPKSLKIGSDDTLYAVGATEVYALKPTGTVVYHFTLDNADTRLYTEKSILGKDGVLYVTDYVYGSEKPFHALALDKTGQAKWKTELPLGPNDSNVTLAHLTTMVDDNGNFYYPVNSRLFMFNSAGSIVWDTTITNPYSSRLYASPDGTVYVGTGGKLTAYKQAPIKKLRSLLPDKRRLTLDVNQQHQITLKAVYIDKTSEIVTDQTTWSSSKPTVATVSGGKVTAIGKGTAYIRGVYLGKRISITVTVN